MSVQPQPLVITVYGSNTPCPSCIHSPSSRETMEWLDAAIGRKFENQPIHVRYVDIEAPETEDDKRYAEEILGDKYFYPLVVSEGEVWSEGDPRLKSIYAKLEGRGYTV